jgi:hypothetical protein
MAKIREIDEGILQNKPLRSYLILGGYSLIYSCSLLHHIFKYHSSIFG